MAQRKKHRQAQADTAAAMDDGTGLVRVKLDEKVIRERGDELASENIKLEGVEEKKAQAVTKFNSEIKLHKQRIHILAQEVDTGPQTSMELGTTGRRSAQTASNAALVEDPDE
jgi:hypothetical protein